MDVIEITHAIFSKPPSESNSIHLDFSDFKLDPEALFKELLTMFTEGMKILYGDTNGRVNLTKLTEDDFFRVNQYFNSFGYKVSYSIKPIGYFEPAFINEKKELKDHFLRLRTDNCIYIVSFDFYICNDTCC